MYRFVLLFVQFFFLLPLFSGVFGQTKVSSCPNAPLPVSVSINDCVTPPCELIRNTIGKTTIRFKAPSNSKTFKTKVQGKLFMIAVDHNLGPQGDKSCDYLTSGKCPLEQGQEYELQITQMVKPDEIKVNGVQVTYKLLDEKDEIITCFSAISNVVDHKGEKFEGIGDDWKDFEFDDED